MINKEFAESPGDRRKEHWSEAQNYDSEMKWIGAFSGESTDLASERPELVQRLSRAFNSRQEEIEAYLRRESDTLDASKLPLRLR